MPNTREKLIELFEKSLRYAGEWCGEIGNCQKCQYDKDGNNCGYAVRADYLIANGVTVQEWIPVSERLPENDYGKHWKERKYYLVRVNPSGLMYVAHYGYKEHDWWIDEHDCVLSATRFKEVTHWMPLPMPPKGE